MCTLVVAAGVVPGHPLVVVANRDEQLSRPARPPFRWDGGFVAPRDELAGGTWLGLSEAGTFVGITNRWLGPRDASRASRGELVARALALGKARAAHEAMRDVDPSRYNAFHLVVADARDVLATISDGRHLAALTLGRGISIVTERSFGAGTTERGDDDGARLARIAAAWQRLVPPDAPFELDRLTRLLVDHDEAHPLSATCIHAPALGYGTRSSMVLSVASGADGAPTRMLWAEGPPCTTAFEPVDLASTTPVSAPAKTS